MHTKQIREAVNKISNKDVSTVLNNVLRRHQNCRDYRVYENYKREISLLAKGNWQVYDRSVYLLAEIVKI